MKIAFVWPLKKQQWGDWLRKKDSMQFAIAELSKQHEVTVFTLDSTSHRENINGGRFHFSTNLTALYKDLVDFKPHAMFVAHVNMVFTRRLSSIHCFRLLYYFGGSFDLTCKAYHIYFAQLTYQIPLIAKQTGVDINRVIECPHCVDTDIFKPAQADKIFDICYVSNFLPLKRQHLIIDAMKLLKDKKLVLIGNLNSNYYASIKAQILRNNICDRVMCMDHIPASQLAYFMNRSRVFVHTSQREGGSRVLMEAMSCGVPVIVLSDCQSNVEMIRKEQGYISSADPVHIARAINYACDHYSRAEELATNARKECASKYYFKRMYEIFDTALESNKSLIDKSYRPELNKQIVLKTPPKHATLTQTSITPTLRPTIVTKPVFVSTPILPRKVKPLQSTLLPRLS